MRFIGYDIIEKCRKKERVTGVRVRVLDIIIAYKKVIWKDFIDYCEILYI